MNFLEFNNIQISKLCLGTVQFGLDYGINNKTGKPKQEEVINIIDYLSKKSINVFDTSIHYGDSQEVLGNSFKALEKEALVISKISSEFFDKSLEKEIDKSIDILNIDSLYGLLLHDTKKLDSWKEEDTSKVKELKEKKKIKQFGVSIYTENEFKKALDIDIIEFIQVPFNIFDLRAVKNNWFEKAKEKGKLIFIRSIFLQGLLLMDIKDIPKKLEEIKPFIKEFEKYAKEFSLSKSELAMSFVNSVAKDSILLFGCDNLRQAKENIDIYEKLKDFDESEIQRVIKSFENIKEDLYLPTKW